MHEKVFPIILMDDLSSVPGARYDMTCSCDCFVVDDMTSWPDGHDARLEMRDSLEA